MSEFIRDNGCEFIYERLIMPARGSVSFSKEFNRSVTGTDRLTCCGPTQDEFLLAKKPSGLRWASRPAMGHFEGMLDGPHVAEDAPPSGGILLTFR